MIIVLITISKNIFNCKVFKCKVFNVDYTKNRHDTTANNNNYYWLLWLPNFCIIPRNI